jgi:hypothetical protein
MSLLLSVGRHTTSFATLDARFPFDIEASEQR